MNELARNGLTCDVLLTKRLLRAHGVTTTLDPVAFRTQRDLKKASLSRIVSKLLYKNRLVPELIGWYQTYFNGDKSYTTDSFYLNLLSFNQ